MKILVRGASESLLQSLCVVWVPEAAGPDVGHRTPQKEQMSSKACSWLCRTVMTMPGCQAA